MSAVEALLEKLVSIPSFASAPGTESVVASTIAGWFASHGIESWTETDRNGRMNVLAVLRGTGGGRSLLLTGHTDTVPPYDMQHPFVMERKGSWLYGRGTVDMKGALAAMMMAMAEIQRSGVRLAGDLWFVGVADEEEASAGTVSLLESGRRWDGAIVGEASNLRTCVAHRGLEWISLKFRGKAAHSGKMEEGRNAITMAVRFIEALEWDIAPAAAARRHEYAGAEVVNVGLIRGGTQPSTVAGDCEVQLDYRWIPGRTWDDVKDEFADVLTRLSSSDSGFVCDMDIVPASRMSGNRRHSAMAIDPGHPLVLAAQAALAINPAAIAAADCGQNQVSGNHAGGGVPGSTDRASAGTDHTTDPAREAPPLTSFPAWSDAGLLSTDGGIPCIVLGPGDLAVAHSAEERIDLSELERSVRVYKDVAKRFCTRA